MLPLEAAAEQPGSWLSPPSSFDDLGYRRARMTGSQSEPPSVEEATIGPRSSIRSRAEPLVAAGLAAHGTIVGLATFAPPPLLIAVVATLVFGGISLAYGRRGRARVGPVPHQLRTDIPSDTVVLAVVGAGCWLIGRGLGTGAVF